MKNVIIRICTSVLLLTLFTACKKESTVQNNGIIGKWKFVAQYDGYANGGTFTWNSVSTENSNTLIFLQNGQYFKKENFNGNFQECFGTYSLYNSTSLEINSNCNLSTEKMTVSDLSETSLIIDRQGIEGIIRYKYVAVR